MTAAIARRADPVRRSDPAIELARMLYASRQRRERFLPRRILGEPGFDILLDLLVRSADARAVCVSSACLGSGVPPSTAMRALAALVGEGLVLRIPDASDGRRCLLRLTEEGEARIRSALRDLAGLLAQNGVD